MRKQIGELAVQLLQNTHRPYLGMEKEMAQLMRRVIARSCSKAFSMPKMMKHDRSQYPFEKMHPRRLFQILVGRQ